jgi:tetratricopeptide (TPR) repeat protein
MNEEFYNRGLELARQKDYAGAIEEFSRALQQNSYFVEAYLKRGLAYFDSGATLLAVDDYTEALKIDSQCVEASYGRALARLVLKNLPGALDDVDRAIRIDYRHAGAYNLRGTIRRKQGFINDAIASFKLAAELYLDRKDAENCRQCMERIKELQPKPKSPVPQASSSSPTTPLISEKEYLMQLLEKAENGATGQAMEDLNWVLQADPQDGIAYCCRGVVRCKQGLYRDAVSDFNLALGLNFQDAVVYRNRGKARLQLGDNHGAIADFNQAIAMKPEDTLVYVARGNAHRAMSNFYGAIQDYSQVLQTNPDDAPAYYNRALAYMQLKDMQRAVDDFQRAASIYCEREDWENYQVVLNKLKKINTSTFDSRKATYSLLRQRLLIMVGGYWDMAQRLIDNEKHYHPGMSEEWYLEKVIYNLERDRQ